MKAIGAPWVALIGNVTKILLTRPGYPGFFLLVVLLASFPRQGQIQKNFGGARRSVAKVGGTAIVLDLSAASLDRPRTNKLR